MQCLSWEEATKLARIHPDVVIRLFIRKSKADRFYHERSRHNSGLAVELVRMDPERREELLELGA